MPENCATCGKFVSDIGVCTFCSKHYNTNTSSVSDASSVSSLPEEYPAPTFKKFSDLSYFICHDFLRKIEELQPFLHDYCPDDLKLNLFIEIVSHITHAVRTVLQGHKELKSWDVFREYLKLKYKCHQYTFNQLCNQLGNVEQKSGEKIGEYADRIRYFMWKLKEAGVAENEDLEYVDKTIERLALNRFQNYSLPEMSTFLHLKGVKTFNEAVQEALEKERRSQNLKKYCVICKMHNHNTVDCCRRKTIPSETAYKNTLNCSYCKIPSHHISECRKKAYNEKNKSNHSPRVVSRVNSRTCNYCKKPGHFVKDCHKILAKNRTISNSNSLTL